MSLRLLFPILSPENLTPTRCSTKACTLVQLEEVLNLAIDSVGLPVQHSVGLLHDCYIEAWVSFLLAGQFVLCVFRLNQWEIAWILEWDGYEHAGVKLEELLFTNMGLEIFQANFVDICCCGGVTAGCLSFPRLRITHAYSTDIVDVVPDLATPVENKDVIDVVTIDVTACEPINTIVGLDQNTEDDAMTLCLDPWSTPMLASSFYASTMAAAEALPWLGAMCPLTMATSVSPKNKQKKRVILTF